MTLSSAESRPIRILSVEDDVSISRLIGLALPELGISYSFVGAMTAEEGLKLWEAQPFDLLLTDYNLPGMRGTELITTLKERGFNVPVILFTAYDNPKLARLVDHVGVDVYLPKPFLMDDMLDAIRNLIDTRVFATLQ